jgi:hypothetical protein
MFNVSFLLLFAGLISQNRTNGFRMQDWIAERLFFTAVQPIRASTGSIYDKGNEACSSAQRRLSQIS